MTRLPAHAFDANILGVLVFDSEEVVNVAIHIGIAAWPYAASHAKGPNGMGAKHPVKDIEIVHVLFDDVVAAQPAEVVPVVDLVVEVRHPSPPRTEPDVAGVIPIRAAGNNIADST